MAEEKYCGFCRKPLIPENIAKLNLLACKQCRANFAELVVLGITKKK